LVITPPEIEEEENYRPEIEEEDSFDCVGSVVLYFCVLNHKNTNRYCVYCMQA